MYVMMMYIYSCGIYISIYMAPGSSCGVCIYNSVLCRVKYIFYFLFFIFYFFIFYFLCLCIFFVCVYVLYMYVMMMYVYSCVYIFLYIWLLGCHVVCVYTTLCVSCVYIFFLFLFFIFYFFYFLFFISVW